MKIVFVVLNRGKGKSFFHGGTLDLLTMAAIVARFAAEKVAEEKSISIETAIDFVCDSIKEAGRVLKNESKQRKGKDAERKDGE